jgi:hypothetical protein
MSKETAQDKPWSSVWILWQLIMYLITWWILCKIPAKEEGKCLASSKVTRHYHLSTILYQWLGCEIIATVLLVEDWLNATDVSLFVSFLIYKATTV